MFKLRQEHIDAFRETAIGVPRERIIKALKKTLPGELDALTEDQLRKLCNIGIEKAQNYEMNSEYGCYMFIAAMLVYGNNFDTDSGLDWSRDFLSNEAKEEREKTFLLQLRILLDTGKKV